MSSELDHALAHRVDDARVVGREQKGSVELVFHRLHQGDDHRRRGIVQVGRGFIGQHQLGLGHQGAGNGHALFLSAGELLGELVALVGNAHRV